MDTSTLPAPRTAGEALAAGSLAPSPAVSSLRVAAIDPPHAGCSGVAVLTVQGLDEHGSRVTAYLHVPEALLAQLADDLRARP